jgi:hypothetical protein
VDQAEDAAKLAAKERVKELLEDLKQQKNLKDNSPETETDRALNGLCYKDFPALHRAKAELTLKSKDPKLDVFFRHRITGMVGTLNLHLDPQLSYTWRQASLLAAKAAGHGINHTRNLRTWIRNYLHSGKLPLHRLGSYHSSILEDEDFANDIQLHLMELSKNGYIRAQDVVDYVASPEVQERLGSKARGISEWTARRWLKRLEWRYGRTKKGMYVDGHEREDVVKYREEFIARWKEYSKRFVTVDRTGAVDSTPTGFADIPANQGRCFRLILVTHDESTFYANDRRKTKWSHSSTTAVAERKGEGQSIMISDFLTIEWGRLKDGEE